MKTDRELVELAAKAVGLIGDWEKVHLTYGDEWVEGMQIGSPIFWNPLVDEGQALLLAVKLKIAVIPYPIYAPVKHSVIAKIYSEQMAIYRGEKDPIEVVELYGGNPLAATCRAIVLVAAMIGESMP